MELAGLAEVAELLGVSKSRVGQLRAIGRLPEPLDTIRSGPVWERSQVEAYRDLRSGARIRPSSATVETGPALRGLTQEQQWVHRALHLERPSIALMYLAGCQLMANAWLPDHLALSAHEFREVIGHLVDMARAPGIDRPKELASAMRELRAVYPRSPLRAPNGQWLDGALDSLEPFLQRFEGILAAEGQRVGQVRAYIAWRDPSRTDLAAKRARHQIWNANWNFFKKACHHEASPTQEEFEQRVAELNRLILEVLGPQEVGRYDAIDALINEVENADRT